MLSLIKTLSRRTIGRCLSGRSGGRGRISVGACGREGLAARRRGQCRRQFHCLKEQSAAQQQS